MSRIFAGIIGRRFQLLITTISGLSMREERRALLLLIPLLRLADSLDRSNEQRVDSIECSMRNGQAVMELRSSVDVELEQWAAIRAGDVFRQVYGRPLAVTKAAKAA